MTSGTKNPEHGDGTVSLDQGRRPRGTSVRDATESAGSTVDPAPIHVLLAEDDELSRRAMVELLKHEGFRVEVAGNGMDALQCFRDQPIDQQIDVVVTDVCLPGQGGYELLQAIHDIRPDMAVIFASGLRREDSGIPGEVLAQTQIAYFEKPIDIAVLAAAIRALAGY